MVRHNELILLALLSVVLGLSRQESFDWKCSRDFCKGVSCPELPKECRNKTKALIVPDTGPCNCCGHCFLFQKEGEDCSKKSIKLSLPKYVCGPNLYCNDNGKCTRKQDEKEKEPLYYRNYECDGDMCYCTALNERFIPKRIFGEFKKSDIKEEEKQCECSLLAYKAMNQPLKALPFDGVYQPSLRCLPNGQFDPLQCIGNWCGCVEKDTGYSDDDRFTYSLRALDLNYPKCFDPKRHRKGEYYTSCEMKRNRLMNDMNEEFWHDVDFIHFKPVNCKPDGTYVI